MTNANKRGIFIVSVLLGLGCAFWFSLWFFSSYYERTTDAQKLYHRWIGGQPPADMELIAGKGSWNYLWQEGHVFLKLKPTKAWWDAFVQQRGLFVSEQPWKPISRLDGYGDYYPDWFRFPANGINYVLPDNAGWRKGLSHGYFYDPETGIGYIHEQEL